MPFNSLKASLTLKYPDHHEINWLTVTNGGHTADWKNQMQCKYVLELLYANKTSQYLIKPGIVWRPGPLILACNSSTTYLINDNMLASFDLIKVLQTKNKISLIFLQTSFFNSKLRIPLILLPYLQSSGYTREILIFLSDFQ